MQKRHDIYPGAGLRALYTCSDRLHCGLVHRTTFKAASPILQDWLTLLSNLAVCLNVMHKIHNVTLGLNNLSVIRLYICYHFNNSIFPHSMKH